VFGLIFIPLLTVHLLLVNVAMGGPFVCLWLEWRGTLRDDLLAAKIGERLARDVVWSLLLAAIVGISMVGLLWFMTDKAYFRGVEVVPVARLWAVLGALVFSLALLAVYTFAWNWFRPRRWLHRTVALLAGTNLIYHFPPFFAAIALLGNTPRYWGKTLTSAEFRGVLFDPYVISQSVHVWLASLAVVGTVLMFYALRLQKKNRAELGPQPTIIAGWGAWLALVPTLMQLVVGAWVLFTMAEADRNRLLGDSIPAAIVFAAAILAALRLMHLLATIALGDRTPRQLKSAIVMMLVTILLMSATLHISSEREELEVSQRKDVRQYGT
jgi:hypothetical protein